MQDATQQEVPEGGKVPGGGEVRWDRLTAPALVQAARANTVVIIPLGAT